MSDPEVPKQEQPADVDHVVGRANAGLDAAAAAGADVPDSTSQPRQDGPSDPDLAAFEAAERDHPGTFATPALNEAAARDAEADRRASATDEAFARHDDETPTRHDSDAGATEVLPSPTPRATHVSEESAMAGAAYSAPAYSAPDDTETRIVPSEPVRSEPVAAPTFAQQPIFVQAPEPPRERGNRGTAGAIGLLATIAFAILYLATTLGLGALEGEVTGENIGEAALAPLMTWGFWVPVVSFFLGFWLLGAFINRGRWGKWVIFGILVGVIAYGGHILGQLFEAPFWLLSASEGAELVGSQLLAPLAIAAFVFARELTIWFGAWVARSGARKTELNEEAQREYERTLEAGPTLSR